jgi:hypothetical protein
VRRAIPALSRNGECRGAPPLDGVEKARTSGVRAGGGATAPTRCEGPLLVAVGILVIALFVVAMSGRNCHFNIHR